MDPLRRYGGASGQNTYHRSLPPISPYLGINGTGAGSGTSGGVGGNVTGSVGLEGSSDGNIGARGIGSNCSTLVGGGGGVGGGVGGAAAANGGNSIGVRSSGVVVGGNNSGTGTGATCVASGVGSGNNVNCNANNNMTNSGGNGGGGGGGGGVAVATGGGTLGRRYFSGSDASGSSTGGRPNKAHMNSGNYMNVVPMPVGVPNYHQNQRQIKYSPQIPDQYHQSRMFFGSEYLPRDRCRRNDEFYPIASTPMPMSDLDSIGINNNSNNNSINTAVSTPPPPPSNLPSVLYTVKRVVGTNEIPHGTSGGIGGVGGIGGSEGGSASGVGIAGGNNSGGSGNGTGGIVGSGTGGVIGSNRINNNIIGNNCGVNSSGGGMSNGGGATYLSRETIDHVWSSQCKDSKPENQQTQATKQSYMPNCGSNGSGGINGVQNSTGLIVNTIYQNHGPENSTPINTYIPKSSNYANTSSVSSTSHNRPLQNVIPSCVYLMSRIAVHMEIDGTPQCPAQVMLAAALGCEELGIANKLLAQSVFGLWMISPLLEIQLKPHNRPFSVRLSWLKLLDKHSDGNPIQKKYDDPMVALKRSVYFSKKDEEKIKDPRIIELLYEEARHNVLTGRYIMESAHSIMLGGIQARIELGPYNVHSHTISYFRENQSRFLPAHVAKSSSWSWLPVSRKTSPEVRLLEQFKRVPATATTRKLMRKYLEFCWALPFYGAAFFHGQVEQPVRGLMSLVNHKDISIIVGINEKGVYIIDHYESTLLLGLRYEEISWDFAQPSSTDDIDCLPCIFIQFDAMENGIAITKLMQIFSRQAPMMDALISHFAQQMRRRRDGYGGHAPEYIGPEEPNLIQSNGVGVLSNKLSRLTLATFDDEGRCIGQAGSLSISF